MFNGSNVLFFQHTCAQLERNMINSLMCLCMPPECVWLERLPLPPIQEVLRIPALRKAILMDSSHNLAKAKRLWFEGDVHKSKKNIIHGLRYLHYGLQLAENGRITDFTAGNVHWLEVMRNPSQNWDDYERAYRPIYQRMMQQIKHGHEPSGLTGVEEREGRLSSDTLVGEEDGPLTLAFIRRHGLQALVKELAISVKPDPEFPALLHLSPDPKASPADHPVVSECACSMLIEEIEPKGGLDDEKDETRRDYRLVAMGHEKIPYLIEPFTQTIDFPSSPTPPLPSSSTKEEQQRDITTQRNCFLWDKSEIRIFEKLDGKMAILYFYAGEWRVASASTPDASDPLVEEMALPKRTYKKWMNSVTLHDEAVELLKRAHRAEEEERIRSRRTSGAAVPSSTCESFAQLFWEVWKVLGYMLPSSSDAGLCFVFELLSQRCKSVVLRWTGPYDRIVLHGVRDVWTFAQRDPCTTASERGWEAVRELSWDQAMDEALERDEALKSGRRRRQDRFRDGIEDCVVRIFRKLSRLSPFECEGIVLCDAAWNKRKIRAPQWTALSLLDWFADGNTKERYLLDIIRRGRRRIPPILSTITTSAPEEERYDSGEFLQVYSEWRTLYAKVENRYARLVTEVENTYVRLRQLPVGAQFAIETKRYFFYGIILAWRSAEEWHTEREGKHEEGSRSRRPWKGLDGWEYYGGWSAKRLLKDIRYLEETGPLLKKSNGKPKAG